MPRAARKKSSTGIYHVMLRGINKQRIFEDEEDNDKFLETLSDCKKVSGFKIYAYCLMGNHVHLLLHEQDENLEKIFKRLGVRYVYWYNQKYGRVGHLFQDRFQSEVIEDEKYLLTAIRYIHHNPIFAGLATPNDEYFYSSYKEYLRDTNNSLIDTEFVYNIFDKEQFICFHKDMSNNDKFIDFDNINRKTDEYGRKLIKEICDCDSSSQFQELSPEERKVFVRLIYNGGLSIRQITRLTGISKGLVEKALKG